MPGREHHGAMLAAFAAFAVLSALLYRSHVAAEYRGMIEAGNAAVDHVQAAKARAGRYPMPDDFALAFPPGGRFDFYYASEGDRANFCLCVSSGSAAAHYVSCDQGPADRVWYPSGRSD